MDNSQIAQRKIFRHFFYWVVFKPLSFLFVSFKIYLDLFLFWSNYWDNWKGVSLFWDPLSFLCFKSLGLDITSVILNPLKMAATYLFLWFLSIKESYKRLIPAWYTLYRKSFINSKKFSFWIGNLEPFRFLYRRYIYEVVAIYWLALTLDPCPWEMNQYFLLELHHGLFTLQPNKKRGYSGTEQTMSSQEHPHSYIKWWT